VDCETEQAWPVRKAWEVDKIRIAHGWPKEEKATESNGKEEELILKIRAGHFEHFQDLFAEVTSPYSDFFGIDPYPVWESAQEQKRAPNIHSGTRSANPETGGKDHDRLKPLTEI
jgi:hypothetical protein